MTPFLNTADVPPVQIATSGLNPVTPGGDSFGWVSGDIANLAANATVDVVFDLGPLWAKYTMATTVLSPMAPSSGLSAVQVHGSDTPVRDVSRRLKDPVTSPTNGFSTSYGSLASSGGSQQAFFRPLGRYVIVRATNADGAAAQGPGATIIVAAYPN